MEQLKRQIFVYRHREAGKLHTNRGCVEFAAQSASKRDEARQGEVGQYAAWRLSKSCFSSDQSRDRADGFIYSVTFHM